MQTFSSIGDSWEKLYQIVILLCFNLSLSSHLNIVYILSIKGFLWLIYSWTIEDMLYFSYWSLLFCSSTFHSLFVERIHVWWMFWFLLYSPFFYPSLNKSLFGMQFYILLSVGFLWLHSQWCISVICNNLVALLLHMEFSHLGTSP